MKELKSQMEKPLFCRLVPPKTFPITCGSCKKTFKVDFSDRPKEIRCACGETWPVEYDL